MTAVGEASGPPSHRRFRATCWVSLAVLASGLLVALGLGGGCSSLVNRAAFFPRRDPELTPAALPPDTRAIAIATADGETLEAYFLANAASDKLVIYFHGNAANIGLRMPELAQVRAQDVNVLGVGYRGYGASTGKPSEAGIYRDGVAALACATDELRFPLERIFLFGRSLGSTVAVAVGVDRELAGIVLVTPLSSGADFARAQVGSGMAWAAGGSFNNVGKAARLRAPVLVVHGTADEVIPFAHGQRLFGAVTGPKVFITVDGGRHNDLEHRDPTKYWNAIRQFLAAPVAAMEQAP